MSSLKDIEDHQNKWKIFRLPVFHGSGQDCNILGTSRQKKRIHTSIPRELNLTVPETVDIIQLNSIKSESWSKKIQLI